MACFPSLCASGCTGVGCHFLLQEIFSTQGLKLGLLHCRLYRFTVWATREVSNILSPSFFGGGKDTGVGCHSLLHGIFPAQGLNPGLRHCRQTLYHLSHHPTLTWLPLQRLWVCSGACVRYFATPWTLAHQALCPWSFPSKNVKSVAISSSRESSQPRDPIHISCIDRQILPTSPPGKPHKDSICK